MLTDDLLNIRKKYKYFRSNICSFLTQFKKKLVTKVYWEHYEFAFTYILQHICTLHKYC